MLGYIYLRKVNVFSLKIFLVSSFIGLIFTLIHIEDCKEVYSKVDVVLEPNIQEKGPENNVWISDIYIDGKYISLGQYDISPGWTYQEEWDDIISNSMTPSPLKLTFPPAKSIIIRFAYNNNFSDHITLYDGDIKKNGISLIPDGNGYLYYVEGNHVKTNVYVNLLMCFSIFVTISYIFIGSCKRFSNVKILFPTLLIYTILGYEKLYISFSLKVLLLLSSLFIGIFMNNIIKSQIMRKYFSKKNIGYIYLASIYAALSSFGYALFLNTSFISVSVPALLVFISSSIWWFLAILTILYFIENIKNTGIKKRCIRIDKRKFLLVVTILLSVWVLALFAYWPGNMTSDSVDQWMQATGLRQINAGHPPLYTFLIKVCVSIIPHPAFFILIQILCFSIIMGYIFNLLFQVINKKIVVLIVLCFALLPCNYMLITTMWKDIPFSICLVMLTLLLASASKEPEVFWHSRMFPILMVISLIGINDLRYNGIIAFAFAIVYIFYCAIKYRKFFTRILITLISIFMIIAIIHGPVYKFFDVQTQSVSKPYITMFSALGSAINKGVTFSENTEDILYSIMRKEDWIKWYSPFNIDSYRHNPEIKGGMNINEVSFSQAFSCYFEGLFNYPGIIIKDRLDGSNIIWDVTQPKESFNYRYAEGIWSPASVSSDIFNLPLTQESSNVYQTHNYLTNIFNFLRTQMEKYPITDIFIFRSGFYLIFYFILLVYNCINKRKWFLVASIPLIGNTIALMLLLAHQSYRYIWYIFLCVLTLLILTIVDFNESDKQKNENRYTKLSANK